ncbi:MAG: metal ABC transporter permease [Desulfobulbaceae bacterium]|jgi:manganese/iron transport system permease protein|nr:metal ABC transporter permease [Desulfobulbaceae bacterium]
MEDFLSYAFIQRAIVAGGIAGALCGLAGVFVVLLRISFVGVCVSHAALAGALVGVFLGFPPLPGAMAFSLASAAAISPLAGKGGISPDTATGVVFSVMLSISMLALGLLPGARSDGLGLIWGNIMTVTAPDILFLALVAILFTLFLVLLFKEIQAVLCDKESAAACGIAADAISQAALLFLGAVIACGMKAVGGLLIYSLIITPAAAAYQLTYRLKTMFILAALFGAASAWLGIWISWLLGWPSGAAIVLAATAILIPSILFSPKKTAHSSLFS